MKLSTAMAQAARNAFEDGTVQGAGRRTEQALIRRGLADEVRGDVNRRNRTSHHAQTVHDAYLGARLNAEGLKVRAALITEGQS